MFVLTFLVKITGLYEKIVTFAVLLKNLVKISRLTALVQGLSPFSQKKPNFQNDQKARDKYVHRHDISEAAGQTWYHTSAYHLSVLDTLFHPLPHPVKQPEATVSGRC